MQGHFPAAVSSNRNRFERELISRKGKATKVKHEKNRVESSFLCTANWPNLQLRADLCYQFLHITEFEITALIAHNTVLC
jgi:hypothetical protein